MSDGLTAHRASPELLDARPETAPRSSWVVVPAQALAIVAAFAAVGAATGWLWYRLWDAPSGVVVGGQWITQEGGLRDDFQGVAWYVSLAFLAGLVLGMLAAVIVGSVLAAYLMLRVGTHLSPADPHELAKTAQDGEKLKGALRVRSWTPKGTFTFGALVGLALVYAVSIGRAPTEVRTTQPALAPAPFGEPPPRG